MKHTIEHTADGLRISAEAPQDKQQALLDELAKQQPALGYTF